MSDDILLTVLHNLVFYYCSSFLLLVTMPGATSSFLLLVAMPFVPSSFLLLAMASNLIVSCYCIASLGFVPTLVPFLDPGRPASATFRSRRRRATLPASLPTLVPRLAVKGDTKRKQNDRISNDIKRAFLFSLGIFFLQKRVRRRTPRPNQNPSSVSNVPRWTAMGACLGVEPSGHISFV